MTEYGSHAGTYALVGWTIDDLRAVIRLAQEPERTEEELIRFMERNSSLLESTVCCAGSAALESLVISSSRDFDKEESQ